MIKVFTTNKNGKIELTKDELKNLLDEAYWDGYRANSHVYLYQTPNWTPYQWTATNATDITLESNNVNYDPCYNAGYSAGGSAGAHVRDE